MCTVVISLVFYGFGTSNQNLKGISTFYNGHTVRFDFSASVGMIQDDADGKQVDKNNQTILLLEQNVTKAKEWQHEHHPNPPAAIGLPNISNNNNNNTMAKYLMRGPNFIMTNTGCMVSSYVWNTVPRMFADCTKRSSTQILEGNIRNIQDNDTVYIPIQGLEHFATKKIDLINASFVLITGSFHFPPSGANKLLLPRNTTLRLLNSHKILKWFCHNPEVYIGTKLATKYAHRIVPFPYGLQHKAYIPSDPNPTKLFKSAFERHLQLPNKTNGIFVSYTSTKPIRIVL